VVWYPSPVSAIAVERPGANRGLGALVRGVVRAVALVAGLALLWGLWEGYRWLGMRGQWTWPFPVNETTMPHIHTVLRAFDQPLQPGGPPLRHYLFHYALFTGKEALAGFALGALIGFMLAVVLAHSVLLRRGLLPYIVISQTVPLLAIAPMVVVGLGTKGVQPWVGVAVIAAYLTFFPVAINTLRGLLSPDPRAVELMRSYAAGRSKVLWRLRVPASMPFVFSALKISATASVIGAIIGETPASLQGGLGYAIVNFNQYYSIQPANLWATIIVCALLGIVFFLAVVVVERLVLKRAPENFA
jgi:NitT/TauT family transport system permease protein